MTLFCWMLIAPIFALDVESNLPPCCRRNGKHHCMMRMTGLLGKDPGFASVSEKCPYRPVSTCAVRTPVFVSEASQHFFSNIVTHPASAPMDEAYSHNSILINHPKRGPPSPLA